MEIKDLQVFLAIVHEQSFSRAALKLNQTQPTLSKRISNLEDELGKLLFVRGGNRKAVLTPEGEHLYVRAKEIVSLSERTLRELKSPEAEDSIELCGEICIGAGETRGLHLIANAMKKMQELHPQVRFHLYSGDEEYISAQLDSGLLDFGLFVGQSNLSRYDYLRLPQSDRFGLLMRKDDPLAAQDTIDPKELTALPLICSRQVLNHNDLAWLLGQGLEQLNVVCTYSLIFNASILVEEGLGYAVAIEGLVDNEKLCFRPLTQDKSAPLSFGWHKQHDFSPAATRFLALLSAMLTPKES